MLLRVLGGLLTALLVAVTIIEKNAFYSSNDRLCNKPGVSVIAVKLELLECSF